MNLITKMPKGTKDILPSEAVKWQHIELIISDIAERCGFGEIRTPTFEHTELFERGVGGTTDVVQKEMYTFLDKGERSITLRPEGTASVARALLENGLYSEAMPQKLYYFTNCFRYEKPQAGRLREFHQFGVEVFGAESAAADAEIIYIAQTILNKFGLTDISLRINSIGCPECRQNYYAALRSYFEEKKDLLCDTCKSRLDKNPMRILDCKSPECQQINSNAPIILDYLDEGCKKHFEELKSNLDTLGISFTVDPFIVRGLDYYTKTVFEFVSNSIGAQGTVCGGGRYDGLIQELGGVKLSGLGFGMGLDRLLLAMDALGYDFPDLKRPVIYIASIGNKGSTEALRLTRDLRNAGIYAENDLVGRSLKAQMKYADKICASYTMVLGDDECDSGRANIKNMSTGETREIALGNLLREMTGEEA
ncbi:MAG: histidine--tRNA ligase [Bacillota bacterium]|nr:histidine--tRNA ligase [Bacillota bacterium]